MSSDFERCARWILEGDRQGWIVCHGFVLGDEDSDHFSHCWLERPDVNHAIVMSTNKTFIVPADQYRSAMHLYTIDEFTPKQIAKLIKTTNSFGPYDRELREIPPRILH